MPDCQATKRRGPSTNQNASFASERLALLFSGHIKALSIIDYGVLTIWDLVVIRVNGENVEVDTTIFGSIPDQLPIDLMRARSSTTSSGSGGDEVLIQFPHLLLWRMLLAA